MLKYRIRATNYIFVAVLVAVPFRAQLVISENTYFKLIDLYPRIITLNSDNRNEYVFFKYHNPLDKNFSLKIFDISNSLVTTISTIAPNTTDDGYWLLKWDGTDSNGDYVYPGVYVYQIELENKIINGSIVVAR